MAMDLEAETDVALGDLDDRHLLLQAQNNENQGFHQLCSSLNGGTPAVGPNTRS